MSSPASPPAFFADAAAVQRPAFFQPALSTQGAGQATALAANRLGEVVSGADDVHQCIHVILATPQGSQPHRPTFGSLLHLYIDHPIDSARAHVVREVVLALLRWEPRIWVLHVQVLAQEVAHLVLQVQWAFRHAQVAAQVFATQVALRHGA